MSLPPTHDVFWERLAGMKPSEVEERSGAKYRADREGYLLSFCGEEYLLVPKASGACDIKLGSQAARRVWFSVWRGNWEYLAAKMLGLAGLNSLT